jgi:hypothetical protein
MSVYDELDNIKPSKLSSELPDEIEATITAITRDTKKQGIGVGTPMLKFNLDVNGELVTTSFRIPKALTGKGQYDELKAAFDKLGYKKLSSALVGKTFIWHRKELSGAVKGNARHYPTKEVKAKK